MADETPSNLQSVSQIRNDLNELAQRLRSGGRLDSEAQATLATLLEELGSELNPPSMPSEQTVQLAVLTHQLIQSLDEGQQTEPLSAARGRLVEAANWSGTHAPIATGIVGRIVDVLSSIGI